VQDKFVGALRLPGDETGDCFKFTNRLAEAAAALGVRFRWVHAHRGAASDRRRRITACAPTPAR
jgi:glycine/D-amino acid oxidase-like deaminating enzyme